MRRMVDLTAEPRTLVGFGRAEVAPLHKASPKTFSLLCRFAPEVHFYPRSLTPYLVGFDLADLE